LKKKKVNQSSFPIMVTTNRRQVSFLLLAVLSIIFLIDEKTSAVAFVPTKTVTLKKSFTHHHPGDHNRNINIKSFNKYITSTSNKSMFPSALKSQTSSSLSSLSSLSFSLQTQVQTILPVLLSSTTTIPLPLSFAINALLFVILRSKLLKVLTPEGFVHSLALGTMLWHTLGWKGWTTCVLYLGLGSAVTKVKFAEKEEMGIAEGRGGRRGPENVWGSAATGLLCAIASIQTTNLLGIGIGIAPELFRLAYVASLATKLSDTFASEIGKAYGKTTFLITTFERVPLGTEGAISLEGTIAAFFGGSLLPLYAHFIGFLTTTTTTTTTIHMGWIQVLIATVAAFLATNAESVIGATLQGKKGFRWMTNEVVNFVNTVIGATIAIVLGGAFLP